MRARALSLPVDRSAAFGIVVLFHIALGYAFYSGLAIQFVQSLVGPIVIQPPIEKPRERVELPTAHVDFAPIPVPTPEVPSGELPGAETPLATAPVGGSTAIAPPEPARAPLITAARLDPRHLITVGRENYPDAEVRAGHEGRCVVSLSVAADGRITDAAIKTGTGFEGLDAACLRAVRGQRMLPATQDGKPVASRAAIPIVWKLDSR